MTDKYNLPKLNRSSKTGSRLLTVFFRMEIPGGGFVGENDEFEFTAPEEGCQSVIEFGFQQGQMDWTTDINTNYYIKFGNPPRYGHIHIQTGISYGGAILTYAINPDDSSNLEPK